MNRRGVFSRAMSDGSNNIGINNCFRMLVCIFLANQYFSCDPFSIGYYARGNGKW